MRDIDKYPITYDGKLTQKEQQSILREINAFWKTIQNNRRKSYTAPTKDLRDSHNDLYTKQRYYLKGLIAAYETLGIYLEFDFINHRGEWFLCTLGDAQKQEDYVDALN